MNPLVSVVIPCFNGEKFVFKAIQSVLEQSYSPIEIVVVDDGSTDGSLDVIRSFGAAVRWQCGSNCGGAAARNTGIEMASGEFIQFLDADDWLHQDKIKKHVSRCIQYSDRLFFCDAQYSDASIKHSHHIRLDSVEDPVVFMLRGGMQTSAPLHRRWWLEEVGGFDESLPCSQERDLHLRIAATDKVCFERIPEVLYTVRRTPGSVSSNSLKVVRQHEIIGLRILEQLSKRESLSEERRIALAEFFAKDARVLLRHGEDLLARRFFSHARRIHRDAGLSGAYGPKAKVICKLFGAVLAEKIIMATRGQAWSERV